MTYPKTLLTSAAKLARQRDSTRSRGDAITVQPPYIVQRLHAEYRAGRRYELVEPFEYLSAIVGRVLVEPGYITDFHTIPRAFWSVLPPDDWAEAAVAHDKLCTDHQSSTRLVSSHEAALVHQECSLHIGSPEWRAKTMFWAIDTFGPHWQIGG